MTTNNRRSIRVTFCILLSAFLAGQLCFFLLPGMFQSWNDQTVDQFFVFRNRYLPNRAPYDSVLVHIDETDSAIQALTSSYISRAHYARIMENLSALGTSEQLWDYIFRAPSNAGEDSLLIDRTHAAGHVYYGLAFALVHHPPAQLPLRPASCWEYLDSTSWHVVVSGDTSGMFIGSNPLLTFPELASKARGCGYVSLQFDQDGIFRRLPLLIRYGKNVYPAFAFRAVCDYLHVPPEHIVVRPGRSITLHGAYRPGERPHTIVIPVDHACNMIVNFIGPWNTMTHYSMATMYSASEDRESMDFLLRPLFKGKIAIVGEASTGAADIQSVPTDRNYPLSGLHANAINTILTENFLHELSPWTMAGIEILLLLGIGTCAVFFTSRGFSIGTVLLLVGYLAAAIGAFLYGNIIFNILRPILSSAFAVFGVMIYRFVQEERAKETLRHSLESYLPPVLVQRMMANPDSIQEVQRREITILFSDIKDFSTYASSLSPEEIQHFLSEYFESMVDIVFQFEGTVDKYIGDGLMVFFGAPIPQADHALRCVRAAIAMQQQCRLLNERWKTSGRFPLQIRIGIHTGEVVVGNMGTKKKLSYTALGSAVNLASRLEAQAPVEGILLSRATYDCISSQIAGETHEPITVKGFDGPIEVLTIPIPPMRG